jgi:predicted acylesterase/phospholipase RssA
MSLQPLRVYVLPVSGGSFVSQLAFLIEVYKAKTILKEEYNKICPDLVLASSGGNISAYVSLSGGWTEAGILRIAHKIERDMFIMSWWPESLDFLPSSAIGIFKESLYRQGYGIRKLYNNNLNNKKVQSTEIWTGTYNKTKSKAQFFCNKKEGTTLINGDRFEKDRILVNCEQLIYTNGDLNLLADITIASASIPVLVKNQPIRNCIYSDGGTAYSSPLSIFIPELYRIIKGDNIDNVNINNCNNNCSKDKKYSLQLIYFSCCDLYTNEINKNTTTGIAGEAGMTINAMVSTLEILDRSKSIDLIKTLLEDNEVLKHKHYRSVNTELLAEIIQMLNTKKHYILNLYPLNNESINLLDFNSDIIIDKIKKTQLAYAAHIWYI